MIICQIDEIVCILRLRGYRVSYKDYEEGMNIFAMSKKEKLYTFRYDDYVSYEALCYRHLGETKERGVGLCIDRETWIKKIMELVLE